MRYTFGVLPSEARHVPFGRDSGGRASVRPSLQCDLEWKAPRTKAAVRVKLADNDFKIELRWVLRICELERYRVGLTGIAGCEKNIVGIVEMTSRTWVVWLAFLLKAAAGYRMQV